jgi:hypothetical protein
MGLTKAPQAVSDWWRRLLPSLGLGKPDAQSGAQPAAK